MVIVLLRSNKHYHKMKLFVATEDYCLLKIRLALALTGKECLIETGMAVEDLVKLDAQAKAMLLETPLGFINQHIAILRYIVGQELVGASELDHAMVDQWLEFSWQELGKIAINPLVHFARSHFVFISCRGSCANPSQYQERPY